MAYLVLALATRIVPKIETKVVLHTPTDIEDGVLAVLEELRLRGLRATVLLEDPHKESLLRRIAGNSMRTSKRWSLAGMLHYVTARYVVITENAFGGYRPPAGQTVVNLWHGEPPAKTVGRFGNGGGLHSTVSPVCSTVGRAYRCAEFGVHPRSVPIVGAARNDRMLRAPSQATREVLLGADAGCPVLIWLPSFRVGRVNRIRVDSAGGHAGLPFPQEELHRLDDWLLERGMRIVAKLHPHDLAHIDGSYRAIRVLSQGELERNGLTMYTALPAFDGLITDMSSIWVDYLLLDKPMVFAFPDIENYRAGRGLNLEPYEHWVPGPFARTIDQLIEALASVADGADPMAAERRRARLRFHRYVDDRSTERLLDRVGLTRRA